jgi:hypothetical protein
MRNLDPHKLFFTEADEEVLAQAVATLERLMDELVERALEAYDEKEESR